MSIGDVFLLIVRWLHLLSAAVWVGGGLFYLLVLMPALHRTGASPHRLMTEVANEFRSLVNTCIIILLATGVILALNRLTASNTDTPYAITLGLKSILSVWMVWLVRSQQHRNRTLAPYLHGDHQSTSTFQKIVHSVSGYYAIVLLGVIIFFLSDLLKILFEITL